MKPENHFAEELDTHMDDLAHAEQKDEDIDERVKYLMEEGNEFHPFTKGRVIEALSNLDLAGEILTSSYISTANTLPLNDQAQILCSKGLVRIVRDYWEKQARAEAVNHFK